MLRSPVAGSYPPRTPAIPLNAAVTNCETRPPATYAHFAAAKAGLDESAVYIAVIPVSVHGSVVPPLNGALEVALGATFSSNSCPSRVIKKSRVAPSSA